MVDQDTVDRVEFLAQGNAQASTMLRVIVEKQDARTSKLFLAALQAQGCTGNLIIFRYRDVCGRNLQRLVNFTVEPHGF